MDRTLCRDRKKSGRDCRDAGHAGNGKSVVRKNPCEFQFQLTACNSIETFDSRTRCASSTTCMTSESRTYTLHQFLKRGQEARKATTSSTPLNSIRNSAARKNSTNSAADFKPEAWV